MSLVDQERLDKENAKRKAREEKLAQREEKKMQRKMEEAGTLARREQVVFFVSFDKHYTRSLLSVFFLLPLLFELMCSFVI